MKYSVQPDDFSVNVFIVHSPYRHQKQKQSYKSCLPRNDIGKHKYGSYFH